MRDLGTSLRALLAEELLVTGGLPVAEVARRLGYLELFSFSPAFRRWKGMGPRAYRRSVEQTFREARRGSISAR